MMDYIFEDVNFAWIVSLQVIFRLPGNNEYNEASN